MSPVSRLNGTLYADAGEAQYLLAAQKIMQILTGYSAIPAKAVKIQG
ncbi:MAG TPA: hypothetical protein VG367_18360 [Mucilaginibacter sp.]|jgi:hypothetical protein|nr:hypothetical protein [Mucilaginibacter sp.]